MAAPFPPPAMAPMIAPSAAPPPVYVAVRLLAPTPDFPCFDKSDVSTVYCLPLIATDCRSSTRSEAPRKRPPFEADLITIAGSGSTRNHDVAIGVLCIARNLSIEGLAFRRSLRIDGFIRAD